MVTQCKVRYRLRRHTARALTKMLVHVQSCKTMNVVFISNEVKQLVYRCWQASAESVMVQCTCKLSQVIFYKYTKFHRSSLYYYIQHWMICIKTWLFGDCRHFRNPLYRFSSVSFAGQWHQCPLFYIHFQNNHFCGECFHWNIMMMTTKIATTIMIIIMIITI